MPILDWRAACGRLDLHVNATRDEIKRRFRQLARKLHPDVYLTPAEKLAATVRFQPLAEAYSYLMRNQQPVDSPPPQPHTGAPFGGATVSPMFTAWDFLEPLKEKHPLFYEFVEALMIPYLIIWGFTYLFLRLSVQAWFGWTITGFTEKHPRIRGVFNLLMGRVTPIVVLLQMSHTGFTASGGFRGSPTLGFWCGLWFGLSGLLLWGLEIASQVVALMRLRHAARALERTLSTLVGTEIVWRGETGLN
jgi:hypothetical protein